MMISFMEAAPVLYAQVQNIQNVSFLFLFIVKVSAEHAALKDSYTSCSWAAGLMGFADWGDRRTLIFPNPGIQSYE